MSGQKNCFRLRVAAVLLLSVFISAAAGCGDLSMPVEESAPEKLEDEVVEPDPLQEELQIDDKSEPEKALLTDYYWPWISHGHLVLSTGEIVLGPDLLQSDLGFIGEFPPGRSYSGRLVWPIIDTDLSDLEWAELTFEVEFYLDNQWHHNLNFSFDLEEIRPVSGESGLQEFPLDLYEEQEGFTVRITGMVLAKNQEKEIAPEPISFLALDVEMIAQDNPNKE